MSMAGMDLGNEKQMSTNVTTKAQNLCTKVILRFSDIATAEKSVKKADTIFF